MKRYRFSWAMFIGAALTLSQPAWAEDEKPQAGPNPEQIFKDLDKNSDGQLTLDEVGDDRRRFFERLVRVGDQNEDGKLSTEEFIKASKSDDRPVDAPRGGREGGERERMDFEERFKMLDTNGDGKLSRSEIPDRAKPFLTPLFDRLDKDEITKEEFLRARGQFGGAGRGAGGENGIPGGGNPEEFFKRLDTNNDGKITLDEVPDRGRPMVERLLRVSGKGQDGSISKEEFQAAVARLQGPGRGDNANRGRPDRERTPEGERGRDGDRKPEGTPRDGERRRDGDRKPEGTLRDGERRGDAERKPEGAPRDGDRPAENERRPEGDRDRDGERRTEGAPRDGEGERRPEGGRRVFRRGPEDMGRRHLPRFFEKIDANHDGRISPDELAKAHESFKELDENGDGHLDPRELMGPPPGGGREGMNREDGDRPGRRPDGDRPEGRETGGRNHERLIKELDKNGDGKIGLDEAPERMRAHFGRLDANGDGQLEASELPARGDFPGGGARERRPEGDRPAKPEDRERPEGEKSDD